MASHFHIVMPSNVTLNDIVLYVVITNIVIPSIAEDDDSCHFGMLILKF
jgi:hypothetical protein